MKTEVLRLDGTAEDAEKIRYAARFLQAGALVAFPTETVYGLGADGRNAEALAQLVAAKGRPPDKPFSLLVASVAQAEEASGGLSATARKLARLYWPGPLTLVVERAGEGAGTVGLRLPEHPVTRSLLAQCGFPLATPSANRSGHREPLTAAHVLEDLDGLIPLVLDGGPTWQGRPSTVVRVGNAELVIQRQGAIAAEELNEAAQPLVLFVCTGNTCRSPMAEAFCREMLKVRATASPLAASFRVTSAGTRVEGTEPADPLAREVMREVHMDLEAHKTQSLNPKLLDRADWIFTMTRAHRESILELMPECRDRIRLLSDRGQDIPDPASRSIDHYRDVRRRIFQGVTEAVKAILGEGGVNA
jgi:tRNA threonylcarbamoyl adenosine modification protein (Sua5/YciO/YrdC/YwlC family)